MSDFITVWQAHRAADDLSNSLASFYENGSPTGQHQLTPGQKRMLTTQAQRLEGLLEKLGVTGRGA